MTKTPLLLMSFAWLLCANSPTQALSHDSYQTVQARFQPILHHLRTLCAPTDNRYLTLRNCASTLSALTSNTLTSNTIEPLALFNRASEHAVAIGIEFRIGRAAAVRIYQVYEYDPSLQPQHPGYLRRRPIRQYMAVRFKQQQRHDWQSLSYRHQGRYLFVSQHYLQLIEQGRGRSNEAQRELARLGPDKDLDYHLKWSDGPALGLNFERLDWMLMLVKRIKPTAQQPVL